MLEQKDDGEVPQLDDEAHRLGRRPHPYADCDTCSGPADAFAVGGSRSGQIVGQRNVATVTLE